MSTTITIRTEEALRKRLEERAAAAGTSLSALIRKILENAVDEQPMGRRAGHLRGCLTVRRSTAGSWNDSIRRQNWRR